MGSSELNSESLVSAGMKINMELGHVTLNDDIIEEAFYHLSPPEDVELARLLLQPEALAPLAAEITITDENYGRVPRIYIELLRDKAISLALQRHFQEKLPCQKTVSIDSDHSPFFSQPEEIVQALLNL